MDGNTVVQEEKLWRADVTVLVQAMTEEEAKEKIENGYVLVDDILTDIEPETMDHLEGESRERTTQKIFRILSRREEHLATSWY